MLRWPQFPETTQTHSVPLVIPAHYTVTPTVVLAVAWLLWTV